MLRRNKYLISLAKKMPNKNFWITPFMKKYYQEYLDKKLTDSMEKFDYIGFKLALCLGANPNIDAKIKKGYHLVTRCARSGDVDLLKLLLDFGGDINGGEEVGGYLPIHIAATKGHPQILELLINYGSNVHSLYQLRDEYSNIMEGRAWTPLICACQQNKTEAVDMLLNLGANHLDKNDLNVSALDIATKHKNREMVQRIFNCYKEKPVTPRGKQPVV